MTEGQPDGVSRAAFLEWIDEFRRSLLAAHRHDIFSALGAIQSSSDLLADPSYDSLDREFRRRLAEDIRTTAQHVQDVFQLLDDLSRVDAGEEMHWEPVDVAALVEGVARALESAAKKRGIGLAVQPGGSLPPIRGDRAPLRFVIYVLLNRILEALPSGGRIDVRCEECAGGVGVVITLEAVVLEAQDRLIAILEAPQGPGMALARRIIDVHGGIYEATSVAAGVGIRLLLSS